MNAIKNALSLIWKKSVEHKFISVLILLVVVFGIYYWQTNSSSNTSATQYVLGVVSKGTIVSSVSGTGQVSASTQLDIKPQVSANVIAVPAIQGESVSVGDVLVRLDSTSAQKSVRDAQTSLDSANLALQKLQQPPTQLSLIQAQDAVTQAQQSKQSAQDDLAQSYSSGFNYVSTSFIDLPGIMTGLNSILYDFNINKSQSNAYAYYDLIKSYVSNADQFRDSALNGYQTAYSAYNTNLNDYKNTSIFASSTAVSALIDETYNTEQLVSEALKNTKNFLDLVNNTLQNGSQKINPPAILSTHESDIQSYIITTNTDLGNLLNIENTIKNDQNTIIVSSQTISEKTEALKELQAGTDPLDIQSQQLAVTQAQNALLDAEQNLSYYTIRAPFDGVVAQVDVIKGDPASSGSAVVSLITPKQIADITLNEVDVSKVKIGQDATLTFDAFPNLTIAGKVAQVDTIGTVSQGVVTYNVEISFDNQNGNIKPGMSVSASIITNAKQNVLLIPGSAIKTQNQKSYVQFVGSANSSTTQGLIIGQLTTLNTTPTIQSVQTGLSNDSNTEITGGLNEGDVVVVRSVNSSSQTQSTSQSNSGRVRIPGIGGF